MKLWFALLAALYAQDPNFDVQSRFVLVPVVITNAQGQPVDGLDTNDFALLDNGRKQKLLVDTIGTGVAPVALMIAVQSSGISGPVLEKVRKIGSMVQPLLIGERGCAGVVAFSDRIHWLAECTHDASALETAFANLQPGAQKEARMLDAASAAIDRLKQRKARRVLLLISESRDRGSETQLDNLLLDAQKAGVTVYAATYSAIKTGFTQKTPAQNKRILGPTTPNVIPGDPSYVPLEGRLDILGGLKELKRLGMIDTTKVLTSETGGLVFSFTRQKGLEDAIEKLSADLHTQYVVGFTPELSTPGYHRLEVQVFGKADLRLRARPGYWVIPASQN